MSSASALGYFLSLKRCELSEVNNELDRRFLSQVQISEFKKDGVLVVDDVFNPLENSNALLAFHCIESLMKNETVSHADINLEAPGGGWKGQKEAINSHPGKIRKIMNLIDHGDGFKALAIHPSLLVLITGLLGPKFRLHSKGFLTNKPPEVSSIKPWHQDSAYFSAGNTVITVWIPLQDANERNACLQVIPGSHTQGQICHSSLEPQLNLSKHDLNQARHYPVRQGGICILDQHIAHYSGHNESPTARQALIFRYEKLDSYEGSEIASLDNSTASLSSLPQTEPGDRLVLPNTCNGYEEVSLRSYGNAGKGSQIMSQQVQNGASLLRILPVSDMLTCGEKESIIEKTHLNSARVFRQKASKHGINFLDMGTDYHYPFYDAYPPMKAALLALKKNDITVLHYPSSFGLQSLRQAFQTFMYSRFSVTLDCMDEIMINTGASQAFDALSRAFKGRYVILSQLALPTVGVIACGNGAELLRIEPDANGGIIDLSVAQNKVDEILPSGIRFLYLNSPVNPTGSIATRDQLCMLVDFAKKNNIIVVHDMDSWYTKHQGGNRLYNIIEIPGAMDCCVTVLSVSKEFGLPGLRVGFIAGNSRVINTARAHNSTFSVMIPEVCQLAAQAALESFCKGGKARNEIDNHIAEVLKATIKGWTSLGWPQSKIYPPSAGFKYLVSVPPNIKGQGAFSSIELFDFFVTSRASVKLSTSRSFNPGNSGFVRIVLMQNPKEVFEVFSRLASIGVSYTMVLPDGLEHEYESFLEENVNDDF